MPMPSELPVRRAVVAAIGCVSAALLMTELALTRIFSVTMYDHFAFLAISIALFGLSASGVYVYLARRHLLGRADDRALAAHALLFTVVTVVALAVLIRLRVGLNYSPENLRMMLAIYGLAALPFFAGGSVISLAISRYAARVNIVYAADLIGAALGCLLLIPLLNTVGAPGSVLVAALIGSVGALLLLDGSDRRRWLLPALIIGALPLTLHLAGFQFFEVRVTKGHDNDRLLFSRWNSFSRVAVYDRIHGDWSLSPRYTGPIPDSRFMDIDSAASTPIVHFSGRLDDVSSLRYELTALAYRLAREGPGGDRAGLKALVIGPGGGRDILSALLFGASHVDAVEINPIIANDVMRGAFQDFSGGIYVHPRVRVTVDDGRSFVRRSPDRYDVIQASLVDTWAATAAGAYTLSENSLYTVEAFTDYFDHLSDDGVITITRWVFDGLRLVSLAQEACARRGCDAADRLAIVQSGRVATFLFKKRAFTPAETAALRQLAASLDFAVLYAPDRRGAVVPPLPDPKDRVWTSRPGDYEQLVLSPDRHAFYERYNLDVRPTTDDRPFFFHTTRLRDQFEVAFGKGMLFGNGLSALLSLMTISAMMVVLFIIGPLALAGGTRLGAGWPRWLAYFSCLGAGFMLVEVALLQRFVLLLGHPVYSLTVTLFSLLLGTGAGSFLSRRFDAATLQTRVRQALIGVVVIAIVGILVLPWLIESVIQAPRWMRIGLAVLLLAPAGALMGVPLPSGMRMLAARQPELVPWAWGMNGALSVVGATLAVFIAMNWGFSATLATGAATYVVAAFLVARRS